MAEIGLYEDDVLIWSEQQAALLRRLAKGERVNDEVDWDNVIDEVESVGSEQLHAVESLLVQALIHMLKVEAWPEARDVDHWRAEIRRFRGDAFARFTPSMRHRLDLTKLYRRARNAVPETIGGEAARAPLPPSCPTTLDELLSEDAG